MRWENIGQLVCFMKKSDFVITSIRTGIVLLMLYLVMVFFRVGYVRDCISRSRFDSSVECGKMMTETEMVWFHPFIWDYRKLTAPQKQFENYSPSWITKYRVILTTVPGSGVTNEISREKI